MPKHGLRVVMREESKMSTEGKNIEEVKEKKSIMPAKIKTTEIMAGVVDKASKTGKKGVELTAKALAQTASGSKVVANEIAKGAKELSDKAKIDSYNKRMKKYNPLFPEEYNSDDFYVPNIISIVDDAVRRDIDVCKGAIGWRENKRGTEVLYLYDEFVENSGLTFVPAPVCDEIYYIDAFDRKRFVKLECIFQQAHEEKIAELEHIAYCLGATSCSIEIEEKEVKHDKKKRGAETSEQKARIEATEGYSAEASSDSYVRRSGKNETIFKGNAEVVEPKLKWFTHDNNILNLIEYRCKGGNEITSKTLELSGSSSATMSKKAAYSIDATVASMGVNQNYSLEDKSVQESEMRIIYHLEF